MEKSRIAAIVPKGKLFDKVFAEGLVLAARDMGTEIERISTEFSAPGSLASIWAVIERASSVIADVTGRNPNVMFLAGRAIGAGKQVIFLSQHGEDFPIGDTDFAPIIYASDLNYLRQEMAAYLSGTPRGNPPKDESPRAQFMRIFGEIMQKHQQEHRGEIVMENAATFVLVSQELDLALVQDLARRGRELGIRIKLM